MKVDYTEMDIAEVCVTEERACDLQLVLNAWLRAQALRKSFIVLAMSRLSKTFHISGPEMIELEAAQRHLWVEKTIVVVEERIASRKAAERPATAHRRR